MSQLPHESDGSFAKLYGTGADQVLVQLTANPATQMPIILFTFNPQIEGFHSVSFVHELDLFNANDSGAVWAQTLTFFNKVDEKFAVESATMHRIYMQKQVAEQPKVVLS